MWGMPNVPYLCFSDLVTNISFNTSSHGRQQGYQEREEVIR